MLQQRPSLLVGSRRRDNRYIQSPNLLNLVEVYLRKVDLLLDRQCVAAPAVERSRTYSSKVTYSRQNRINQPVQEFIHHVPPQRYRNANGHASPQLERCDRFPGLGYYRLLTGNRGQLGGGAVEHLRVRLGFAPNPHIQYDLLQPGHCHLVVVAELLLHSRLNLIVVTLLESSSHLQPRANRRHLNRRTLAQKTMLLQ